MICLLQVHALAINRANTLLLSYHSKLVTNTRIVLAYILIFQIFPSGSMRIANSNFSKKRGNNASNEAARIIC